MISNSKFSFAVIALIAIQFIGLVPSALAVTNGMAAKDIKTATKISNCDSRMKIAYQGSCVSCAKAIKNCKACFNDGTYNICNRCKIFYSFDRDDWKNTVQHELYDGSYVGKCQLDYYEMAVTLVIILLIIFIFVVAMQNTQRIKKKRNTIDNKPGMEELEGGNPIMGIPGTSYD